VPAAARPDAADPAPPADAALPDFGRRPADAARPDLGRPRADAARLDAPRTADGSIDELLRAAGLDPGSVDAETLASLGEILKVVVGGVMEVLRARAELKNQFRVAMTTLRPVENNPLKFSASAEDALFNLFARRGQSFKAPVDAFREAFDDLKAHQIAMMAGMRAAFGSLLKRFDPEELQTGFDRGLKRAAILDVINKTKYWELYREMYAELGDDDTTFRRLFGDEFAEAYEEQMQRLTALHKR
jgi:type VI secretion system FHA domain protein